MALDRESVDKATPFYKSVTRQDRDQDQAVAAGTAGGGGGGRSKKPKSRIDDARSVLSAGSRVVGVAKRIASKDSGQKAMLAKASLTSVQFELVRSNPWETVMRAGISGLNASFSANEEGGRAMNAAVTLTDILLTDVRPEAKDNAYKMILAPLVALPTESAATGSQGKEGGDSGDSGDSPGKRARSEKSSSAEADVSEGGEDSAERGPLIAVTAKMDGDSGNMDAEVKLASFACNLMVEPIKESLVVMNEVNAALIKMFASKAKSDGNENAAGERGALEGGASGPDSTRTLDAVDEEGEYESEVRMKRGVGTMRIQTL